MRKKLIPHVLKNTNHENKILHLFLNMYYEFLDSINFV